MSCVIPAGGGLRVVVVALRAYSSEPGQFQSSEAGLRNRGFCCALLWEQPEKSRLPNPKQRRPLVTIAFVMMPGIK